MSLKYGNDPVVSIDLQPGIYLLPTDSAVGKSYLAFVLKDLENVDRVTSHAFPSTFDAARVLDNSTRDVVLLDRYDMRTEDYVDEMRKFAEKGILLVDFKTHRFPLPCRRCRLLMTKDELVVR